MNNSQFRQLYKDEPDDRRSQSSLSRQLLGDKKPSSRSSQSNSAFAESIRARSAFLQPTKKFKSREPKGSRTAAGYIDRAKARADAEEAEQDERAKKIADLEAQLKKKEITREEFEAARNEITAGDIGATHLVKGLDWKLLERIRHGEDVMQNDKVEDAADQDVDDELEKLEDIQFARKEKAETQKQGTLAASAVANRKRTRDEIMAEMKAQRRVAAADRNNPGTSSLDNRWRTANETRNTRIEHDRKGREILVILDETGAVKKKLRRSAPSKPQDTEPSVDTTSEILDVNVVMPESKTDSSMIEPKLEEEDDIFEGVGTAYDPLGDDDDSEDQSDGDARRPEMQVTSEPGAGSSNKRPQNYFNDKPSTETLEPQNHFQSVEAVIAKAAKLAAARDGTAQQEDDDGQTASRRAKHAAMLDTRDRDMDDMDMGFGASRFEDGEDDNAAKQIKLSEWSNSKPERKQHKSSKRKKDTR